MRILYCADLHLSPLHLPRLLKLSAVLSPDAIIVGGDLFPWSIASRSLPLARRLKVLEKYVRGEFIPAIEKWRSEGHTFPLYLDLGNDDPVMFRPILERLDGELFHLIHRKVMGLCSGLSLAGYMHVPITPFRIKDWDLWDHPGWVPPDDACLKGYTTGHGAVEDGISILSGGRTIEGDLNELAEKIEGAFVFVSHSPPYGTALDIIDRGVHRGSQAIRSFVSAHRPVVSLHGHIHESFRLSGKVLDYVGGVPCLNPGAEREALRALFFDTSSVEESLRLYRQELG